MASIKEKLAHFIESLDGAQGTTQQELNKASALLKEKHIQIPENEQGKEQVADFIRFLFTYAPQLQNDSNKARLKSFVDENIPQTSKQPSHRGRQ